MTASSTLASAKDRFLKHYNGSFWEMASRSSRACMQGLGADVTSLGMLLASTRALRGEQASALSFCKPRSRG